jgi:2-keto-3-deoxy-L-rhamnonate aldolase RhmA
LPRSIEVQMILDAGLKFALFPMVRKNKQRKRFLETGRVEGGY